MTRVKGSGSSGNSQRPQQAAEGHEKLGLGSLKPHKPKLPKKPSDLLKDPTPKPPTIGSLPKPPASDLIKPPKPPGIPGLPNPHQAVLDLQHRVSEALNNVREWINPKPSLDPREQRPSNQIRKD